MASIIPHKDGFRVQAYVGGVRDSKVLRTRREANAWGAARKSELKRLRDMPVAERHTLGEALTEYSNRVSTKKGGTKWEQNRIAAFIRQFPEYAERPLSQADTPMSAERRDRRLAGYIAPDGAKVRGITNGSVLREINLYRNVYMIARKEWKWIDSNPFTDLGILPDNAARASASIPIVFAPVNVAGGLMVDGGTCDNMPVSDLTVDAMARVGSYLVSDDDPLPPGSYGFAALAPHIIDLMLAACEATHLALDSLNGAKIVRVPTSYASSFDRHMAIATRERLYNDGYEMTRRSLPNPD